MSIKDLKINDEIIIREKRGESVELEKEDAPHDHLRAVVVNFYTNVIHIQVQLENGVYNDCINKCDIGIRSPSRFYYCNGEELEL